MKQKTKNLTRIILSMIFLLSFDYYSLVQAQTQGLGLPARPNLGSGSRPSNNILPPPPPGRPTPTQNNNTSARSTENPVDKEKFSNANLEDITNENFPELISSFDFPNADINDVVKAISKLTGKNFILDPNVRGKITIIAPTQITVAEAYKAFLSALAINKYTVVPSGRFLKVTRSIDATNSSEIFDGAYIPNTDQMITKVIQLKYIQASDVNKFLRTIVSKESNLLIYEPTNTLIISDYGSNINRIAKVIKKIDVANFDEQMEVIPIRYAKSSDIAELLEQIINNDSSNNTRRTGNRRFSSGVPRFGRGNQSSGNSKFSTVIPDERTNSIIVVGSVAGIDKIKKLIKKLDFEIRPEDAGGVYVYYVRYGEAESIADTLNGVAQAAQENSNSSGGSSAASRFNRNTNNRNNNKPTGTAGAIFDGNVKIASNKETNTLIVTASRQDYEVVLNLLKQIDIPRDQVYVEAVIMEMAVGDNLAYGASYFSFVEGTEGRVRQGFNSGNFDNLLNTGSEGVILGFGSGENISINVPDLGDITVKSVMGLISFLKTVTMTNILSTPQILAMDNEEAEIEVGDKVPVALSTTSGTSGTTSQNIDREELTIKLKITPFISPDRETVRMKVDQQVKGLSNRTVAADNLSDSAVITTTRTVKSNVAVKNGDTVVIGGLMKDETRETVKKVPLLGDIPILGWLFKSKTTSVQKMNLLIFLTPKIIRTRNDGTVLSQEKLDDRLQFIKDNMGGTDTYGRKVDEIRKSNNAKTTTPAAPTENLFDELGEDDLLDEEEEL